MILQTGQHYCYDAEGNQICCAGSGQDAEFCHGISRPSPRFEKKGDLVTDLLTGLVWPANANLAEFPLTWQEALDFVADMSRNQAFGFSDWRLPNRRELHSLIDYQARKPSLPSDHPFENVFLGWYWTSTTAAINTAYAWYIHFEGARMFYGRKDQYYLLWPVRGAGKGLLPRTGQRDCFDSVGRQIPCSGTGQDGELQMGASWPEPRFRVEGESVVDRLTKLRWHLNADLTGKPVSWPDAFAAVKALNGKKADGHNRWRLPNINELESLVDCSRHSQALPLDHPFQNVQDVYWSSTTSFFETNWSWALYLHKGALGVGVKNDESFFVWPVCHAGG